MAFKFQDNSKKVKAEMAKVSEKGVEAALLMIEAAAKSGAKVDTGDLRDSINHRVKASATGAEGSVGTPLKYGVYVEYGTGEYAENGAGRKGGWIYKDPEGNWHYTNGSHAQPFLRPAFRQNTKKIKDILGKAYGASFNGK